MKRQREWIQAGQRNPISESLQWSKSFPGAWTALFLSAGSFRQRTQDKQSDYHLRGQEGRITTAGLITPISVIFTSSPPGPRASCLMWEDDTSPSAAFFLWAPILVKWNLNNYTYGLDNISVFFLSSQHICSTWRYAFFEDKIRL